MARFDLVRNLTGISVRQAMADIVRAFCLFLFLLIPFMFSFYNALSWYTLTTIWNIYIRIAVRVKILWR